MVMTRMAVGAPSALPVTRKGTVKGHLYMRALITKVDCSFRQTIFYSCSCTLWIP